VPGAGGPGAGGPGAGTDEELATMRRLVREASRRRRDRLLHLPSAEPLGRLDLVGIPLDRPATERGTTPFDLMLDLALSDAGTTRYRVVLENEGDDELADLLADKRTLLGLSDAGAHASQLCDACYSTHLLGHWVRERGPCRCTRRSGSSPASRARRSGCWSAAYSSRASPPTWWRSTRTPSG
jgi:hypothetical protein